MVFQVVDMEYEDIINIILDILEHKANGILTGKAGNSA